MALDRILVQTRAELEVRRRRTPTPSIRRSREGSRSLRSALAPPHLGYLLECKRRSPSEGILRQDADPVIVARAYAPFADAISVLTNGPFFGGTLEDLRVVRGTVTCPVLRKDFVVDPWQVREAAAAGADAVLLMLSVLGDAAYLACRALADDLGLDTLTEVHTAGELARAIELGAPIIGINNRNLHTLEVDLGVAEQLAPRVPEDRLVVAESGYRTHAEVRRIAPFVDGILVGSALMTAPDLNLATRKLLFGMTKICGLTNAEDAEQAYTSGATHGGLVFVPASPRAVTTARAQAVRKTAPLAWVGVFADASAEEIVTTAHACGLSVVQLHGTESPEFIARIRPALPPGCAVWKGVRVQDHIPRVRDTGADMVVLDAAVEGHLGGTGQQFDWRLLDHYPDRGTTVLAGGLTAATVHEAERLDVAGLDVSTGVERAPGQKCGDRLTAFLLARRGAGRRRGGTA